MLLVVATTSGQAVSDEGRRYRQRPGRTGGRCPTSGPLVLPPHRQDQKDYQHRHEDPAGYDAQPTRNVEQNSCTESNKDAEEGDCKEGVNALDELEAVTEYLVPFMLAPTLHRGDVRTASTALGWSARRRSLASAPTRDCSVRPTTMRRTTRRGRAELYQRLADSLSDEAS